MILKETPGLGQSDSLAKQFLARLNNPDHQALFQNFALESVADFREGFLTIDDFRSYVSDEVLAELEKLVVVNSLRAGVICLALEIDMLALKKQGTTPSRAIDLEYFTENILTPLSQLDELVRTAKITFNQMIGTINQAGPQRKLQAQALFEKSTHTPVDLPDTDPQL